MRYKILHEIHRSFLSFLIYSHSIVEGTRFLKRSNYEDAYFELLYKDKVHGRTPSKTAVVPTRFDCMQLCKNQNGCKSINWHEDNQQCELVKYDRHNAPTYTDQVFSFL